MKIKYRHHSEPEIEKIYDTEVALINNPSIKFSQKEFDEFELKNMARDKEKGYILDFSVIEIGD